MRYSINCKCGRLWEGHADRENYGFRCRCGKTHIVNPSEEQQMSAGPVRPANFKHSSRRRPAANQLAAPANALITCSSIMILLHCLLIFMLLMREPEPPELWDKFENRPAFIAGNAYAIRILTRFAMLVCSAVVLVGAVHMRAVRNFGLAQTAAILFMIPFVGPCYVLGLPVGIWAMIVLYRPAVRAAFI